MKKLLTKILVGVFVVCGAITMFACGGKSGPEVNQTLTEALATIQEHNDKAESKMLTTATAIQCGVASDFALRHYVGQNEQYAYYNQLFIVPMNYIQKYSADLDGLSDLPSVPSAAQDKLNKITNQTSAWLESFDASLKSYDGLAKASQEHIEELIEGRTAHFNRDLKQLVKNTYDIALNLADIKNIAFNQFRALNKSNKVLDEEDTAELRDYVVLQLSYDFYKLFFENLNMQDYSNLSESSSELKEFSTTIKSIKNVYSKMISIQALENSDLKDLTGEAHEENLGQDNYVLYYTNTQVDELLNVFDVMTRERDMLYTSLEKCNLNKFYVTYTCNLESYAKEDTYIAQYYNEISRFYTTYADSYLTRVESIIKK